MSLKAVDTSQRIRMDRSLDKRSEIQGTVPPHMTAAIPDSVTFHPGYLPPMTHRQWRAVRWMWEAENSNGAAARSLAYATCRPMAQ